MRRKQKAYGYITRRRNGQLQVLVFDHIDYPDAGTQVPGGSVDPGETPVESAVRECYEEAGVTGLTVVRELGVFELPVPERGQLQERHFVHLVPLEELPDRWDHTVTHGDGDKGLRFRFFWIAARQAAPLLAGQQGIFLPALFDEE